MESFFSASESARTKAVDGRLIGKRYQRRLRIFVARLDQTLCHIFLAPDKPAFCVSQCLLLTNSVSCYHGEDTSLLSKTSCHGGWSYGRLRSFSPFVSDLLHSRFHSSPETSCIAQPLNSIKVPWSGRRRSSLVVASTMPHRLERSCQDVLRARNTPSPTGLVDVGR